MDDEESNAALVRCVLTGAGDDVDSTTLSRRTLVMLERTAYDAVSCDVKSRASFSDSRTAAIS